MVSQTKVTNLAEKRLSLTDISTISGQFRLVDGDNRLKCLFWDGMHEKIRSGTLELETIENIHGALHFPHNTDSQLGTGRIKAQRTTFEFKRPEKLERLEGQAQDNLPPWPSVITIRQSMHSAS